MSTTRSEPQTVKFRGAEDIALVADEWNRGAPFGAAPAATSGQAPPSVLLLHGGGQNRFSWKNTGQILADQGLHVVALDSRGHGDSDRAPKANYTVDALCADTLAVLEQIGRPVILIGASMGGMTGILVADAAGPEKVTKLVLVDVVPRYEKDGSARIRDFMFSHVHGFETLEEAADAVAEYLPHRTKPRSPEGLKKNLRKRGGRWYWHWDPKFLDRADRRSVRPRREAGAGRDRSHDPDSADPRQAVGRGERRRRQRFPCQGAKGRVRRVVRGGTHRRRRRQRRVLRRRRAIRQPVTTDSRSAGFNFLEEPELPAPRVSEAQAEQILAEHYGLRARATSLGSQQDKNFMVADPDGKTIGVLKIANPAFSATELEAQDVAADLIAEAEPIAAHRCAAAQSGG